MNTDPKSAQPDPFALPAGLKIRARKFGAQPGSEFVPALVDKGKGDTAAPRPLFELCWEDRRQGLSVRVREGQDGRLIAAASCTDGALLNKAAVSVGLVGAVEGRQLRKTIPLDVPEKTGCSGSADIGLLTDAVQKLGPQLAVVVFLVVCLDS